MHTPSKIISVFLAASLAACATNPDKMMAADVSPLAYQNYDCGQLGQEERRISRKVNQLYQQLDKEASSDAWQTGVGIVLFWPALFFLEGGDGHEAAEYKQLKGEYEAIQEASIARKCGAAFTPLDEQIKAQEAAKKGGN